MISGEERREVASSLRRDAAYGEGSLSEWWGRLQFIVLDEDDFPKPREVFEKLADLVDRTTMSIDVDKHGCAYCTKCGCDDCCLSDGNACYCPKCGAEVE